MNIGGEPGRDDYGLPPVDVEIPDDARELDRDVQAYHRELRAQRRRVLARRLYAPLARDGMVLPLLAGCLALTLLAGTLLTVFTAGQREVPSIPRPGASQPARVPLEGMAGGSLPDAIVTVGGQAQSLQALASGATLVLALVPASCQCLHDLRVLTREARAVGAQPYLVGAGTQLLALSKRVGLGVAHAVEDTDHVLPPAYHPNVLTALLVRGTGRIAAAIPASRVTGSLLRADLRSPTARARAATGSPGKQRTATATAGPRLSTPAS